MPQQFLPGLQSDATTWVMRDREGQMRRVRVVDMTDQHLWRWIRYFRRKYRQERGFVGSDDHLDAVIKADIITAPAIYAEAYKRNVISGLAPPAPSVIISTQTPGVAAPPQVEAEPGKRKITLDEE
jgi:hypothetical protein